MRRGFTLVEALFVVALIGLAAALAVPAAGRLAGRLALQREVTRIQLAYRQAWSLATSRRRLAILRITPDSIAIRTVARAGDPDTLLAALAPGPRAGGVELQSPPHTAVFGPDGIGMGATNTTHVLTREGMTRKLVVSRLGRIRVD
jgi:prepilin-type N-terminal cleavage/methylation domain-containing protein